MTQLSYHFIDRAETLLADTKACNRSPLAGHGCLVIGRDAGAHARATSPAYGRRNAPPVLRRLNMTDEPVYLVSAKAFPAF